LNILAIFLSEERVCNGRSFPDGNQLESESLWSLLTRRKQDPVYNEKDNRLKEETVLVEYIKIVKKFEELHWGKQRQGPWLFYQSWVIRI